MFPLNPLFKIANIVIHTGMPLNTRKYSIGHTKYNQSHKDCGISYILQQHLIKVKKIQTFM